MQFSKQTVKRAFSQASNSYDASAVLQKEILSRLIEKLKVLHPDNVNKLLDVGSGTGLACQRLTDLYGDNSYFAYDFSPAMLRQAKQVNHSVNQHCVCGDAENLAYTDNSFDVIFSASTYQWCNNLANALVSSHHTLNDKGLFIFSTFGPETLKELRECFSKVDDKPHVSSFHDIQIIGDSMLATGFTNPVVESEIITVEYASPLQLLHDLKATGATNHLQSRTRGLMGKSQLRKVLSEYEKLKLANQKYPASYQVIYAHGWKKLEDKKSQDGAQEWQPISLHEK